MTAPSELERLRHQVDDAQARLDALLDARERAQEGRGLAPTPAEVDRARDMLEAAEALLRRAEREVD